jgi:T4-like virus tail tube protein gp19
MAFDVTQFRTSLQFDGARANLFDVQLPFPTWIQLSGAAGAQTPFRVKAAQLPGTSVGMAPLYYFGREVKFAGNRTFADWTIQVVNDEDFTLRSAFEQWANGLNDPTANLRNPAALVIDGGYGADPVVTQYGKTGSPIAQYQFIGVWPLDVSPIEVDWGQNDAIEEFTVTLAVQYYLSSGAGDFSIAAQ